MGARVFSCPPGSHVLPMRLALLALVLALAACGSTPSSGPTQADVRDQSVDDGIAQYEIIDVDARVLAEMSERPGPSLVQRFGSAPPSGEMKIGAGDGVTVTIWEVGSSGLFAQTPAVSVPGLAAPPVSNATTLPQQYVASDGAITVPFAGRVVISGLTPEAAGQFIQKKLRGKAMEPQVIVSVSTNLSNTAAVMGEVSGAARVPLSARGERLLDVIASAGGIKSPVYETVIRLTRAGQSEDIALEAVLKNAQENVFIQPGDVITVSRQARTFTVLGAIGANATVPFGASDISLAQAIGRSGGLIDSRSDAGGVFVFRYESAATARLLNPESMLAAAGEPVPVVYRIDMSDPGSYFEATRFAIYDRDLIFVSNAPVTELQKLIGSISPFVGSAANMGLRAALPN